MIERYTTKEMGHIWSDNNKYSTWLKVEIEVSEVLSEMGIVPKSSLNVIKEKAQFSVERINEIESKVHHDVIAFLTNLSENNYPIFAESRLVNNKNLENAILAALMVDDKNKIDIKVIYFLLLMMFVGVIIFKKRKG